MKNQQKLFPLFLVMDNAFEVSILKVYIRRVTFTSYSTPPPPTPPPPQEKITSQICPPPSHNFFSLRFFWYYSGWFLYWDYVMFLFFPKIIWTPFLEKLTPYNATLPPPESKSWMFSKVFCLLSTFSFQCNSLLKSRKLFGGCHERSCYGLSCNMMWYVGPQFILANSTINL